MSNRLSAFLRERGERKFRVGVELADVFSTGAAHWAKKRRVSNGDMIDALITALVSYVQFACPYEEWADVAPIVAEEIQQRLTVRQVNDD